MIELQSDLLSILTLNRLLNLPTLAQKQCFAGRPKILLYTEHPLTKLQNIKMCIISS